MSRDHVEYQNSDATNMIPANGQPGSLHSGDEFGFWRRGLCISCAPLRYMQRRFDEKVNLIKAIAKMVGVNLGDVFGPESKTA